MSGDVYVLCVSIVPLFTNLVLDLGTVLTVCYVLFLALFQQLQSHHQVICM